MAHGLAQASDMFYMAAGGVPWHRLGVPLEVAPQTGLEAVVAIGAHWTAEKRPMTYQQTFTNPADPENPTTRTVEVRSQRVMVRSDTQAELGVVGPDYTPLQNVEVASFFDDLIRTGAVQFETGGVLHGGSKVWFQVKTLDAFEVMPGDTVQPYLMVTNSHDGSIRACGTFTSIRAVCANTVGMALREGARVFSIRHTSTASARLKAAESMMRTAIRAAEATREAFSALANKAVDDALAQAYFEQVYPLNPEAKSSTRTENIHTLLHELRATGRGVSSVKGVEGTLWGAYNAVTELVDHHRGLLTRDAASLERDEIEKRVESIWYGNGAQTKQRALNLALEMV